MSLIDLFTDDTSLSKVDKQLIQMIVDSSRELDNVIRDIVNKTKNF